MAEQELLVAGELIDSFNAGDWERFEAVLAPDVSYEETGTGRRLDGSDAYMELARGWKQAFPDATGEIRSAFSSGATAAQEITWVGTHTGPLETPDGTISPTGKAIEVHASIWYTIQDGKVKEARHYLDVLSMLQQIGVFPM